MPLTLTHILKSSKIPPPQVRHLRLDWEQCAYQLRRDRRAHSAALCRALYYSDGTAVIGEIGPQVHISFGRPRLTHLCRLSKDIPHSNLEINGMDWIPA